MSSVIFKDVEIPAELQGIIDHMRAVEGYRVELSTLGQQWDLLTILGQTSGDNMDMTATREGFKALTSELLGNLATETLKKTIQKLNSKAQVAVDIVIRNLFERTADIGFLATDDDIREFIRGKKEVHEIEERFREYVAKYSVYDDIVLLGTDGKVLAQLDQKNRVESSSDALIRDALTTEESYVEIYRKTDLRPHQDKSLIYAFRVTETNDPGSKPLGVLCLCFRFENEMEGVFANLSDEMDWSVITLLDKDGKVISSSDEFHIPLGATMSLVLDKEFAIVRFAGQSYLAKTCPTKGYQGYMGAGWYGHALLPLQYAFEPDAAEGQADVDAKVLSAVMTNPRLFSKELQRIPVDAERIQNELDRTVWNGNIRQEHNGDATSTSATRILLWEISKTGHRTKAIFEQSIGNLHETVVSTTLGDVEFLAALAIDIMDRNLYERANDCRWWALTSAFRELLSQPKLSDSDRERVSSILDYINGLYTVYTNLFVFDKQGVILAVSNPSESGIIGTQLAQPWVRDVLSLTDTQHYSVSAFEMTDLYSERPTYIYGAAISAPNNTQRVVGGIGIVFDSEPQFYSMLDDCLPKNENGEIIEGCFGVIADRNGSIVSSTSSNLKPLDKLPVDSELLALAPGEATSRIVEFEGHYFAVGAAASAGYREYKSEVDRYSNDLVSVVFIPLGDASAAMVGAARKKRVGMRKSNTRYTGTDEVTLYATFFVGDHWLGIRADLVIESISIDSITPIPGLGAGYAGTALYRDTIIPIAIPHTQMSVDTPTIFEGDMEVIVVRAGDGVVGLIVDNLGEILEVPAESIDTGHSTISVGGSFVDSVITPQSDDPRVVDILFGIDPEKLQKLLGNLGDLNGTHPAAEAFAELAEAAGAKAADEAH